MRSGRNDNVRLSAVPTGTGNDFVRAFEGKSGEHLIDVMKVGERYAVNVANTGFDCRVEIIKDDGEHVDLGFEKFGRAVRDAGNSVVSEIRSAVDSVRASGEHAEDPAVDEEIPFEDANKEE